MVNEEYEYKVINNNYNLSTYIYYKCYDMNTYFVQWVYCI